MRNTSHRQRESRENEKGASKRSVTPIPGIFKIPGFFVEKAGILDFLMSPIPGFLLSLGKFDVFLWGLEIQIALIEQSPSKQLACLFMALRQHVGDTQ